MPSGFFVMKLFRTKTLSANAAYELIQTLPIRIQKQIAMDCGVFESNADDFAAKIAFNNKVESITFSINTTEQDGPDQNHSA